MIKGDKSIPVDAIRPYSNIRLDYSRALFIFLIILCLGKTSVQAQESMVPVRTENPPVIDGLLDEQIWQEVSIISGFQSYLPDYTDTMTEQTEVRMAYDDENLYFAFRCYDKRPDKIKATLSPRDKIFNDDWVCVNLDSFNDQQGLYTLYVNPFGIQQDARFGGWQEDPNFDMVWFSAGVIDSVGYTVEVEIPLTSIRYKGGDTVTMGVVFERFISRKPEAGTFPPLDPEIGMNFYIQMMPIQYTGLRKQTLLEVLPAFTYTRDYHLEKFKLKLNESKAEFSLTTKVGITSDLIFDATINPDFSQIEADAQQVDINLRHSLYFPEKRPFFLEGKDQFNISSMRSSEVDPMRNIIYTRTMRNPKAGAKLTGKIGKKNTIATLYVLDELPSADTSRFSHFGIARYKRKLSSDGYLGGLFALKENEITYNRIGGFDGLFRVNKSQNAGFDAIFSFTKQNDTLAENKGYSLGAFYRQFKRNLDFCITYREISGDFTAMMGYVTRTGIRSFSGLLKPKVYPSIAMVSRIDIEFFSAQAQDLYCNRWETFNHVSGHAFFPGNLSLKVKYSYSTEVFHCNRFKTGGFHIYAGGQLHKRITLDVLYRRVNAIYYSTDPYQGVSNKLTTGLQIQPSDNFNISLNYIYFDFARAWGEDKIYKYPIGRMELLYQVNKYLFFRAIAEYNQYHKQWLSDFLISFTYIPGTVVYLGYGSLHEAKHWNGLEYTENDRFIPTYKGLFIKASYLFRK